MALDIFTHRTRSYQQEMFERSLEGNRIIMMDTGSGKTQVAMLRIRAELDRCSPDKRVWFLAPTVELCTQQHNVLRAAMPAVKMCLLTGLDNVDKWSEQNIWDAALDKARVIVSTHAVLADALRHGFVRLQTLALLVFDEAHHCIKKHPANVIMRDFYHPLKERHGQVPHILGLSASLIISSNLRSVSIIEGNLDAISVTPRVHREDLLQHVHHPECRMIEHDSTTHTSVNGQGLIALCRVVSRYEAQCTAQNIDLSDEATPSDARSSEARAVHQALKKFRTKAWHLNEELGPWAADYFIFETVQFIRLKARSMPEVELDLRLSTQRTLETLFEEGRIEVACSSGADAPINVSAKVVCLIDYLLEKDANNLCGIVFATQRVVASVLSVLLNKHPRTAARVKCMPFVGTSNATSRKYSITELVDLRRQRTTLGNFRSGDVNLIVATSVLEEGIDVQACNVVVCFDPPTNLKSFIQRRGRARHRRSRLGVLIPADDDEGIVGKFQSLEAELTRMCQEDRQAVERTTQQEAIEEEMSYVLSVSSTGARLDADSTLSHLHHFCELLTHEAFADPRPNFTYESDTKGLIRATVTLPNSVPARVRQATSKCAWITERAAKKDAAFQAYAALREAELINDNLLPLSHDWNVQGAVASKSTYGGPVNIESHATEWSNAATGGWTTLECRLTPPPDLSDNTVDVFRLLFVAGGRLERPPPVSLHWSASSVFQLEFGELTHSSTPLPGDKQDIYHTVTTALYRAARPKRLWRDDKPLSAYLIPDMLAPDLLQWQSSTSLNVPGARSLEQVDGYVVRVAQHDNAPYFCKGRLEHEGDGSIICERPPRRRNFLSPVSNVVKTASRLHDAISSKQQRQVMLPPGYTFSPMPLSWTRVGLLMSAIFQHIHDYMNVTTVMSNLLGSLQLTNREQVLTALCAPSALRSTNYQRHEAIGDSILKFITSCHLFITYLDWPEGYLTQRRATYICNATLTSAAQSSGLSQYIITEPVDYGNWTLPVIPGPSVQLETRTVSSKLLADVVEALIGVSWLDGGMPAALQCIHLFIPDVPATLAAYVPAVTPRQRAFAGRGEIEALIGYTFNNSDLLFEALTHPSYGKFVKGNSYERLEFLGDAVLDMIVTDELAARIDSFSQGHMTSIKAALVNGRLLGFLCLNLRHREQHRAVTSAPNRKSPIETTQIHETCLASHMYYHSEDRSLSSIYQACDVRYHQNRDTILELLSSGSHYPWLALSHLSINKVFSDLIESIMGAIFLDAGQDRHACMPFLERLGFRDYMTRIVDGLVDVMHPRERFQRRVGSRRAVVQTQRDVTNHSYSCRVAVDDVTIEEVQDCFDEEEALMLALTKAEQALAVADSDRMEVTVS